MQQKHQNHTYNTQNQQHYYNTQSNQTVNLKKARPQ